MNSDDAGSTYVEIDVHATAPSATSFDEAFDAIADLLPDGSGSSITDLAGNVETQTLTFCVTFSGTVDPESALGTSLGIARDAIHDAGLDAAAWEVVRATVEPHGDRKPHLVTA